MNEPVKFIRVRGRVIPIRPKQDDKLKGVAYLTASSAVAVGSGVKSASLLNKSWNLYKESAKARGTSKGLFKLLKQKPSKKLLNQVNDMRRVSAGFRVAGKSLSRRGFGIAVLGAGIATTLGAIGAENIVPKRITDEKRGFYTTAISSTIGAIGLLALKRKVKPKVLGSLFGRSASGTPRVKIASFFKHWTVEGQKRTAQTIRKYEDLAMMKGKDNLLKKISKDVLKRTGGRKNPNQPSLFDIGKE